MRVLAAGLHPHLPAQGVPSGGYSSRSLCGTPPPPRTWGQSSPGWGWGPWVIYEGSSRDSEPSSQEENHQACNARPHLAPGAARTHARAAAILVPAKPAPALLPSTAPARASAGSAPRPAAASGPFKNLASEVDPWRPRGEGSFAFLSSSAAFRVRGPSDLL